MKWIQSGENDTMVNSFIKSFKDAKIEISYGRTAISFNMNTMLFECTFELNCGKK